ncbi:TOBE domain-containing protein [Alcaligenes faecalis]|jgi:molybdate transport system regulatory protein|uniref:Molybdenum-dependent transcriptional regulator n=1 Tax=Alcaligenes faecalis TaxID=511 RepID=A0A0M7BXK2_ALCFA|nr:MULTISPECIES: TOBE domain-containing protein [Alcaligenes]ALO37900.1 molybdenum-dependent transcriptional regulator [Alcaligenes faecalis]ATH98782.1 molybdenum-dependent transcriptional regulator [Alcaligenes faecalis]AYZ91568.1 LysR family transcriptional regulator [Alcaligenes faecalis]MBH0312633.1 TOBE domain-containing protein [Alcaligenes faecalis]MBW4790026.1 TOBE domain-containing protein [Alcaligenes faecalis subsp. faecalis]
MSSSNTPNTELTGSLSLRTGDHTWGSARRMALLAAIAEQGSISAAARHIGISYKAAWDAIDIMNNMAGEPLVLRSTGGHRGGGATLTPKAIELLELYQTYDRLHQRFMSRIGRLMPSVATQMELLQTMIMQTSARNQLPGIVTTIKTGAVNDEIHVDIGQGQTVVASITRESTENLGLREGQKVLAFLKASSIMIGTGDTRNSLSARNQLPGTITDVITGAVNAEVRLELPQGLTVTASITLDSTQRLHLEAGQSAYALFKASSVMIATL